MRQKDILKDIKPTPHYKLYPKSKITIRVFYAIMIGVFIWAIWWNWDFWSGLFK